MFLEWRWCVWLGWSYACSTWQLPTGLPGALSWVHLQNETLQSANPRVRAGIPSLRKLASKEMISASVDQCETNFTCPSTSHFLTHTCDFRRCTKVHMMLIVSLQDLLQNPGLWNNPSLHCCAVFPTKQSWQHPQMCQEWKKSNASLSNAWVHFVSARTNLFSDHKKSCTF